MIFARLFFVTAIITLEGFALLIDAKSGSSSTKSSDGRFAKSPSGKSAKSTKGTKEKSSSKSTQKSLPKATKARKSNKTDGGKTASPSKTAPMDAAAPTISHSPSQSPTSRAPTQLPTRLPTTNNPTKTPTAFTTKAPNVPPVTAAPTKAPNVPPVTAAPTKSPTSNPTRVPTHRPTSIPANNSPTASSMITFYVNQTVAFETAAGEAFDVATECEDFSNYHPSIDAPGYCDGYTAEEFCPSPLSSTNLCPYDPDFSCRDATTDGFTSLLPGFVLEGVNDDLYFISTASTGLSFNIMGTYNAAGGQTVSFTNAFKTIFYLFFEGNVSGFSVTTSGADDASLGSVTLGDQAFLTALEVGIISSSPIHRVEFTGSSITKLCFR